MAISTAIGLVSFVALVAFIVFAFRQGNKVKPDKNRKTDDWPRITQGGSS